MRGIPQPVRSPSPAPSAGTAASSGTALAAALTLVAALTCLGLASCTPLREKPIVVLDEAFSALHPELARELSARGRAGVEPGEAGRGTGETLIASPLTVRRWKDGSRPEVREGGRTLIVPLGEALAVTVANPTGGQDAAPAMIIAGFDFNAAYSSAGRAAGLFIAKARAAGKPGAKCVLLFAPGPSRPIWLAEAFRIAYFGTGSPADGLVVSEMASGDKAAADPEGELRAALTALTAPVGLPPREETTLSLLFVAADSPEFAVQAASEHPGTAVGLEAGAAPLSLAAGTRLAFMVAGDGGKLVDAVFAAARAPKLRVARITVPAKLVPLAPARRFRAGDSTLRGLLR